MLRRKWVANLIEDSLLINHEFDIMRDMSQHLYDYVILGSGMGGLSVGSLLANSGHKVCLIEAHEHPGGCAHNFPMGPYTLNACVHYIFFCGEGEPVYNFLKKLNLHEQLTFNRLDPEGFDHFSCPTEKTYFRIPNGLEKWSYRLADQFPIHRYAILRFFNVVQSIAAELKKMPHSMGFKEYLKVPFQIPSIARYRNWTVQNLFDKFCLPPKVQAILSTQSGDCGLAPENMSLILYVGMIWGYGLGAYYPQNHFTHFVETLADVIKNAPGSEIRYKTEVCKFEMNNKQVQAVHTTDGTRIQGKVFISNIDPKSCVNMIGKDHFPKHFLNKIDYEYSSSAYILYLGLKGIDLRDYGFGNWNIWHYPHLDINRIYQDQINHNRLDDPWVFLSSPSLQTNSATHSISPQDTQLLSAVTFCNYSHFNQLQSSGRKVYVEGKFKLRDRILDVIERHYIPNLRKHIVFKTAGTPTTHAHFLWTPGGNAYGARLNPRRMSLNRLTMHTPIDNLFLTGATTEFPGVGATISGGCRLYTHLTGDFVNPARDLYNMWV